MKYCSSCANRWFGNHAYPRFAQWHCRIGKKIVLIGKTGSDEDLLAAKACKEFKT